MRFPLKIVNVLSQQFAGHGLQFFKVNRTVTHVAVARPRYLDLELTPVSEGVRRIVDFVEATPNCTRRKILEALVPTPPPPPAGETPAAPAVPGVETPPSPEMAAVISDLHWLIHQGHVIEFAKGLIELAKKPLPRPPRPEPAPTATPAVEGTPTASEEVPAAEVGPQPEAGVVEVNAPDEPVGAQSPIEPLAEPASVSEHAGGNPMENPPAQAAPENPPSNFVPAEPAPAEPSKP
jgi:hypothetical protein